MRPSRLIAHSLPGLLLAGCGPDTQGPEFGGVIAESYEDSVEWWPEPEMPREGSPNVVIFLLDDVGFAQIGSFGGLIETPNIDRLASNGLRFNNFHTTALCSPSRASLMAGRYPHSIGLGSHALTAMGFPGYNAIMPESAKSVAAPDAHQHVSPWRRPSMWVVTQAHRCHGATRIHSPLWEPSTGC